MIQENIIYIHILWAARGSSRGSCLPVMPLSSEQKRRLKDPTTKVKFEQENTKSPGSKAYQRYEQYKGSTTIHDATQNGAQWQDITVDFEKGWLVVEGLADLIEMEEAKEDKRSKKDTPRRNTRPWSVNTGKAASTGGTLNYAAQPPRQCRDWNAQGRNECGCHGNFLHDDAWRNCCCRGGDHEQSAPPRFKVWRRNWRKERARKNRTLPWRMRMPLRRTRLPLVGYDMDLEVKKLKNLSMRF